MIINKTYRQTGATTEMLIQFKSIAKCFPEYDDQTHIFICPNKSKIQTIMKTLPILFKDNYVYNENYFFTFKELNEINGLNHIKDRDIYIWVDECTKQEYFEYIMPFIDNVLEYTQNCTVHQYIIMSNYEKATDTINTSDEISLRDITITKDNSSATLNIPVNNKKYSIVFDESKIVVKFN